MLKLCNHGKSLKIMFVLVENHNHVNVVRIFARLSRGL